MVEMHSREKSFIWIYWNLITYVEEVFFSLFCNRSVVSFAPSFSISCDGSLNALFLLPVLLLLLLWTNDSWQIYRWSWFSLSFITRLFFRHLFLIYYRTNKMENSKNGNVKSNQTSKKSSYAKRTERKKSYCDENFLRFSLIFRCRKAIFRI